MFDAIIADKFLNSLFINNLKFVQKIKDEALEAAAPVAVLYAETNNPEHREVYLGLKSRVDTMRKLLAVMLSEPATTLATRNEIYKVFPELNPSPPVIPVVKPPENQVVPPDIAADTAAK